MGKQTQIVTEKSRALPSFMYLDPATVAERMDARTPIRPERGEPQKRKRSYGLLSAETLRMVKRARIRELVRKVLACS